MAQFEFSFEATGTLWQVDIDQDLPEADKAVAEEKIKQRVSEFEKTYSRFRDDSLVARFAKTSGKFVLPEDAKPMFDIYFKLYKLTGGLFTPLMGKMLEDAGYDAKYSLVSKDQADKVLSLDECLVYDFPNLEVLKPVKMDFGACGKGHIIDIVGQILSGLGIDNYCIDAGGDILYCDKSGKTLRVGLENPSDKEQVIGICEITDESICGSSGSRRKWGKFNHIINPNTFTSPTEILATWVCAKSTMVADALATCLFFVEPVTLEEEFDLKYLILYKDFSIKKSSNFAGEFFNV